MPFINLRTNNVLDTAQKTDMAHQLSTLASRLLGKSEQWVMRQVDAGLSMCFAGTDAPCAYLECKSIGLSDTQIPPLAQELGALLHTQLGIEPARIYIEFTSAQAQQWGWNGSTF
jgi:phenylpyruvate tautomerase PptA (4-oxalocrotonate tautomerase family)